MDDAVPAIGVAVDVLKALGVAVRASGSAQALAIKTGLTLAELETASRG